MVVNIEDIKDGSVTYDHSVMAEAFSMVFQRKQCDQILNLPSKYFPNLKLTYFASKSSEIRY